jgi:hypothetical protein
MLLIETSTRCDTTFTTPRKNEWMENLEYLCGLSKLPQKGGMAEHICRGGGGDRRKKNLEIRFLACLPAPRMPTGTKKEASVGTRTSRKEEEEEEENKIILRGR